MTDNIDHMLSGIVSSAPVPREARPITWADMEAAFRSIQRIHTRDRYVIPASRWHRIMRLSSPESRAELQSLRDNGTIIISPNLPDDNHAYRIDGSALDYQARQGDWS